MMRLAKYLLTTTLFCISITIISSFFSACATRVNPSGGPRDTTAPALDTSFPANYSLNFSSKKIELIFDEYLNLKNPSQQIMITPLQKEKPEISLSGKTINIELIDSLIPNTTYTISFGASITDFTEGNINKNFKYIFSTGTYIDSLKIEGKVTNAYSNTDEKDLLVALYEIKAKDTIPMDSLPFLALPTYYAYTTEDGYFSMENLKEGNFKLYVFEDGRNSFQLQSGMEKMAFYDSLIHTADTNAFMQLKTFKPALDYKFYGAKHINKGQLQFNFSRAVPDIEINRLTPTTDSTQSILIFSENKDTATYWFDDEDLDSIAFIVKGYEGINDTSVTFLRKFNTPQFRFKVEQTSLRNTDTALLKSNLPIQYFDKLESIAYSSKDTFSVSFIPTQDPLALKIIPEKRPQDYSIKIKEKTAKAWFDVGNDSLDVQFKSLKREDLGNLNFSIKADSNTTYILEIYNPSNKKIVSQIFSGNLDIPLNNYLPGEYRAQLIVDRNKDGNWTTGNLLLKQQPETVIPYTEKLEVRANWDLELEWKVINPK